MAVLLLVCIELAVVLIAGTLMGWHASGGPKWAMVTGAAVLVAWVAQLITIALIIIL